MKFSSDPLARTILALVSELSAAKNSYNSYPILGSINTFIGLDLGCKYRNEFQSFVNVIGRKWWITKAS